MDDHLSKAKHHIEVAPHMSTEERAMLKVQMATTHALIALVERMDRALDYMMWLGGQVKELDQWPTS